MYCTKAGFDTEAEAKVALMRAKLRPAPKTWKVPVRAYVCPDCSLWHLTSRAARART